MRFKLFKNGKFTLYYTVAEPDSNDDLIYNLQYKIGDNCGETYSKGLSCPSVMPVEAAITDLILNAFNDGFLTMDLIRGDWS